MEFKEFTRKVSDGVQQFLGKEVTVSVHNIRKNNGVYMTGMTLSGRESNMSPTVYLESFYDEYGKGKTMASVVRDIVKIYERTRVHGDVNMDFFANYKRVEKQIFCKIINYEKNRDVLQKMPHRRCLDLAVVCYLAYTNEFIGNGTIQIYKSHMKNWKIDEQQLIDRAIENTKTVLGHQWMDMPDLMEDMLMEEFRARAAENPEIGEQISKEEAKALVKHAINDMMKGNNRGPMCVVTNRQRCMGAICILFQDVLDEMAERMGGDFVILPSSVHEVILVPGTEQRSGERLKGMVREINAGQVEAQEVLSDNIYYYNHCSKEIVLL